MVRANGWSVARAAPEARTGGNSRWRGAVNFQFAPSGAPPPLILFGGETSVAFVLAAKPGRGCAARTISFTLPWRGRVAARRDAGWGARRCRDSQRATRAFTPSRRASRVDLPPPGEGEKKVPAGAGADEKKGTRRAQTQ